VCVLLETGYHSFRCIEVGKESAQQNLNSIAERKIVWYYFYWGRCIAFALGYHKWECMCTYTHTLECSDDSWAVFYLHTMLYPQQTNGASMRDKITTRVEWVQAKYLFARETPFYAYHILSYIFIYSPAHKHTHEPRVNDTFWQLAQVATHSPAVWLKATEVCSWDEEFLRRRNFFYYGNWFLPDSVVRRSFRDLLGFTWEEGTRTRRFIFSFWSRMCARHRKDHRNSEKVAVRNFSCSINIFWLQFLSNKCC
jgi:hypothetical protein